MNFKIECLNETILDKKYFTLPFSINRNVGVWRDENNEIIALIQGRGLEDKNTFDMYIEYFEVKIKYTGYGKKCIYSLFELYPNLTEVTGESKEGAITFWENIGGFFIDYCEDCDNLDSCIKNGYCCEETQSTDFTITRDNIF